MSVNYSVFVDGTELPGVLSVEHTGDRKINEYNGIGSGYFSAAEPKKLRGWSIVMHTEDKSIIANSVVAMSGNGNSTGNYIVVNHGVVNGEYLRTYYLHLRQLPNFSVGAQVSVGNVLGYMGNTEQSTGVHLHFMIRKKSISEGDFVSTGNYYEGVSVNPKNYFDWL